MDSASLGDLHDSVVVSGKTGMNLEIPCDYIQNFQVVLSSELSNVVNCSHLSYLML